MNITDTLTDIQQLYIGTAPIIYYIEANPTYIAKMDLVIEAVETVPIKAVSSVIVLTEMLAHPLKQGNLQLEQQYHDILIDNVDFQLLPVTISIAKLAATLRSTYYVRTPDALHLVTAINGRCNAFLINDLGLKRIHEIPVLILDELELPRYLSIASPTIDSKI